MHKTNLTYLLIVIVFTTQIRAQKNPDFQGQAMAFGNYSPDFNNNILIGGRYIPQLNYTISIDSAKKTDFEASANLFGAVSIFPPDSSDFDGNINPYRIWARFTGNQFEIRLGLQKIDFGSATLLRPLQWFNQIDPRDPLALTNGVYGALGRYYFLNNANIWLWILYGNEKTRGSDALTTYTKNPEFGGRVQYPVPKGEIAASYHHRTADSLGIKPPVSYGQIPEDRFALDGKWDVKIGLWFEASYIHKSRNIGLLTNQTLLNLGADYTFGLGNGLNVIAEHLLMGYGSQSFGFTGRSNISAATLAYPMGLFDNLSSVLYYSWDTEAFSVFVNYQHQFKNITGYIMAYYNPGSQQGIRENELFNQVSGPGIRLMLVYNH